jgi:hypothetical protein
VDPDGRFVLRALRDAGAPRALIAATIARLGRADEIASLVAWLDDGGARAAALEALATFGPAAASAVPAIERAGREMEHDELAFLALAAIDPDRRGTLCERILERTPRRAKELDLVTYAGAANRRADLLTLAQLGPPARAALPALLADLDEPDVDPAVLVAAASLDPDGDAWLPTTLAWLGAAKYLRPSAAVDAIEAAGRFTPQLRDALLTRASENARLLAEFASLPAEAAPLLLAGKKDDWGAYHSLAALARVESIVAEHLAPLLALAAEYPDRALPALARLDADARAGLRTFVDARTRPDAPPREDAIARVLAELELTRDEARAILRAELPDARCGKVLAWLE